MLGENLLRDQSVAAVKENTWSVMQIHDQDLIVDWKPAGRESLESAQEFYQHRHKCGKNLYKKL